MPKIKLEATKVTLNLRKARRAGYYHLVLDSYPVIKDGRKKRIREHIGPLVSSVVWEKQDKVNLSAPKRDRQGYIVCSSEADYEACKYAENLRRQIQTQYYKEALLTPEERERLKTGQAAEHCFIDFMEFLVSNKTNCSESTLINWRQVVKLLKQYTKNHCLPIKELTIEKMEDIKDFLLTAPQGGFKKGVLSQNSASTYFNIIKAGLSQCYKKGYLTINLATIKGIPERPPIREFLTDTEVQVLIDTPWDDDILRRASIFAILTGMRHSDIYKLTWGQIQEDGKKCEIHFKQQKTSGINYLPISEDARKLCGERRENEKRVFEGLQKPSWISRPLSRWVASAGIQKHITFHCFRHTFATLQLVHGTDIYTVSKMLGHTDVKTTQIYAKIVDELKLKATSALHFNLKNIL